MPSTIGTALRVTVWGQSHSAAIGCVVEGLPAGYAIDTEALARFMARRAPGQGPWSTPRKEADLVRILSGLNPSGETCGAPLSLMIENTNTRSGDYDELRRIPRPGHADWTAQAKWGGHQDIAGGGHFSGRLTAPVCAAGGIALQLLATRGVRVAAHLAEVADKKAQEASESFQQAQKLVDQMQETYNSLSAEAQALYAQEQAAYATQGGVVNDDGTVTDIETGAVYDSPAAYVAATGNAIVDRARSMIGSAYVWGGVGGDDGGFDCSGLVSYALTGEYTRVGTSYSIGDMYARVSDPQAGDLYVTDGHIAVYTGEGTLVHAVDYGIGVAETEFREKDGGFFVRPQ